MNKIYFSTVLGVIVASGLHASQAPKKPQEIKVTILNESGLPVKAGISIIQVFPRSAKQAFVTSTFPYDFSFTTDQVFTLSVDPSKEHIQEWQ